VGAFFALMITGIPVDMFSLIGFVMLLGLVAKNSILLVDYANQWVRKGMDIKKALMLAGKVRLRPILMTTAALIAGMLPLAVAFNETAKFRQSMGIAVIGGLLSSTLLTLLVIPAAYELFDDARSWLRQALGRPKLRKIEMEERKKPKSGETA
jgi:multidrug efflux pump subunit AcrB